MKKPGVRTIKAGQAQIGQWIVYDNERNNQRIIDINETRDGQVKISADYGHGGEPATMFFEKEERIRVA